MTKKAMTGGESRDVKKATPGRALSPWEEMERMFSGFPRTRIRPLDWEWPSWGEMSALVEAKMPKLDIVERDNEVVVRAELAGVDKKDIDVSVTDSTITIKGCTKKEIISVPRFPRVRLPALPHCRVMSTARKPMQTSAMASWN